MTYTGVAVKDNRLSGHCGDLVYTDQLRSMSKQKEEEGESGQAVENRSTGKRLRTYKLVLAISKVLDVIDMALTPTFNIGGVLGIEMQFRSMIFTIQH